MQKTLIAADAVVNYIITNTEGYVMKRSLITCLFVLCVCHIKIFGGVDEYKVYDKEYLKNVSTILFIPPDTLKDFYCDVPQGYYIDLFLIAMSLGINGYTNYEVIDENSTLKKDLRLEFTIVTLHYSTKKKPNKESSSYKTRFSVDVHGYNPENNKQIFYVKKTCTSYRYTEEDELKDNILEATDNLIEFFSKQRKKPLRKSFYINKMLCNDLKKKKMSYILLGDKNDPFQKKLMDVIEAEMQQYFYKNKIMILKLEKPLDSLLIQKSETINLDLENTILSSDLEESFKKASIDFLFIIDQLTAFKSEKLPVKTKKFRFRFVTHHSYTHVGPIMVSRPMVMGLPADDPSADMEEMNAYDRIFCNLHVIDIHNNSQLLRTQLYLIEDNKCEDPEKCFAKRIVKEWGEFDTATSTVSPCFVKTKKKIGRKRKK